MVRCPLEGRFEHIRTRETNLGDLICDIMRDATKADCVILNSGTFRSDAVHETGTFKMKVNNCVRHKNSRMGTN